MPSTLGVSINESINESGGHGCCLNGWCSSLWSRNCSEICWMASCSELTRSIGKGVVNSFDERQVVLSTPRLASCVVNSSIGK